MSNEYDIARIYKDMEQEIISSMQRNLSRHIEEEKRVGFNYPQWQAEKLRSLRKYRAENMDIINSYTEGLPQKVKALMQTELKQGFLSELAKYKEALAAGYESSVIMKDSFFKINTRKVNNLIKSIGSDLAKANQACLRYTDDAYRKVIFQSEMYVANGVFTEKKAIEKAIDDFAKRGIHCIEYADGSMRDIADYADMAIKTASQRAQLMGEGEFRKKLGTTLIIISKHGGTCPLCAKWEGKILIDDVYSGGTRADGDYPLLSEAMAAGLYHPRCRHGCGTYYPEVEDIWNEKDLKATEQRGIIQSRNMANGMRISPKVVLTNEQIEQIKIDAKSINIPIDVLRFNNGYQTGFLESRQIINVRGDIIPDLTNGVSARDKMSSRAVLAHEYYGHYKNHPSLFEIGDWRDEFRASYCAALNTPNLTTEERVCLMVDAFDRAREKGVSVVYNKNARRIIYGIE